MQYMSYRPYLQAVSFIRHLRTYHVVIKKDSFHIHNDDVDDDDDDDDNDRLMI